MPDSEVQNMQIKNYQIPERQVQITEYVVLEGGKPRNLKRCTNPRAEETKDPWLYRRRPDTSKGVFVRTEICKFVRIIPGFVVNFAPKSSDQHPKTEKKFRRAPDRSKRLKFLSFVRTGIWVPRHFGPILSGFAPGCFENFLKICPDWYQGVSSIIRGPGDNEPKYPSADLSRQALKLKVDLTLYSYVSQNARAASYFRTLRGHTSRTIWSDLVFVDPSIVQVISKGT